MHSYCENKHCSPFAYKCLSASCADKENHLYFSDSPFLKHEIRQNSMNFMTLRSNQIRALVRLFRKITFEIYQCVKHCLPVFESLMTSCNCSMFYEQLFFSQQHIYASVFRKCWQTLGSSKQPFVSKCCSRHSFSNAKANAVSFLSLCYATLLLNRIYCAYSSKC